MDLIRQMEKYGIRMLKRTKPILSDLGTYLTKVFHYKIKFSILYSIFYLIKRIIKKKISRIFYLTLKIQ